MTNLSPCCEDEYGGDTTRRRASWGCWRGLLGWTSELATTRRNPRFGARGRAETSHAFGQNSLALVLIAAEKLLIRRGVWWTQWLISIFASMDVCDQLFFPLFFSFPFFPSCGGQWLTPDPCPISGAELPRTKCDWSDMAG